MNKRIKLKITKVASKLCGNYVDNQNCLVAIAAKRQFKTSKVSVGRSSVTVDKIKYRFGSTVEDKILRCYLRRTPEELFEPCRIRPDFRPFNIVLTRLPL